MPAPDRALRLNNSTGVYAEVGGLGVPKMLGGASARAGLVLTTVLDGGGQGSGVASGGAAERGRDPPTSEIGSAV